MERGYVKFPRYIFSSKDWTEGRELTAFEAQCYLLQAAAFAPTTAKVTAHISVTLQRGQLLTSVRRLAKAWGWPQARVQRFLESLKSGERGRLRITTTALDRGMDSVITIVDYDTVADTPCDTISDTLFDTRNVPCSALSLGFSAMTDTESDTPFDTQTDTHKEKYKEDKLNTHTLKINQEGGPGGDAAAQELYAFVCAHYPELQQMRFPLSLVQCGWILRKVPMKIAKRLFAEMHNKRVYERNSSVYSTFTTFSKYDIALTEQLKDQRSYTYNEMCDMVYAGCFRCDDFTKVGQNKWILKRSGYASS